MFKKKFHGGLFLFFFTLFALLFINTCSYANTNVTREYLEWIWDYQLNNTNYVTTANTNCNSNKTFISNNFNKDTCITDIYNKLSQYQQNNNITQFGNVNLSVFPRFNDYTMAWFFVLSNSGAPSGLDDVSGFLYVKSPDRFGTLEDNVYIMKVYFNGLNGSVKTLSYQYETRTSVIDESSLSNIFINNSLDVVTIRNCCFALIPHGYYYYNNNYIPVTFQSLGGNFVPSQNNGGGDNNSGDVVGDITNSSGENTGNINLVPIVEGLNNIQNQISGDTTRIIENQNNNTQTIVNQLSGDTTRIIENTNKNIEDIFDTDNPDTSLSDILDTASGEFENPYSIDSINNAFIDSFSSAMEEDFIISWSSHNFNAIDGVNVQLIPSGEINFSKICRENQALGNVKEVLSIICISGLGVTMLVEFYNLVLATFGIGNYFYAETSDTEYDLTSVDNDTGQVRSKHIIRSGKKRK